jgi:septal ring factor EnvC (AmiA/AmiB activator)
MNPLQPSPMFYFHRTPNQPDDVEILQTDVMRFFAILCLCLMAIFALVKTLPMAPAEDGPKISEPDDLRKEAQSLQFEIAALKKKLAETHTQLEAAAGAAQQSSLQARQAEKDEQAFLTRLGLTRQELKEVSQSLKKTGGELKKREKKLAELLSAINDKQRIRSELKTQIKNETRDLRQIQAALDRAREKANQSRSQNQHSVKKPAEESRKQQPVRKGFTLRFVSDEALQRLIASGQVKFYAMAAQNAWQLQLTGGRPVYISAKSPRQIYEMETATVPIDFLAAFKRQVAAFGRTTLTWGVTLPAQTTASINQLIAGRDGGDLAIMPDGEVILN